MSLIPTYDQKPASLEAKWDTFLEDFKKRLDQSTSEDTVQ